jgi:hypothetical protein
MSRPTRRGQRVAIKEYLPNTLALRSEGQTAPIITEDHLPAFRYGMKCFFEEGRALAGLSHPNVIRVLNFFRANETVYMVMEYEHGRTLQELIQKNRAGVTENFIRNVFTKMLNGLREVHAHSCCISTSSRRTSTCATTAHAGADRLRRGPPDAGLRHADAQADVHAGLRLARALSPARSARPMERHLQRRRLDVCLHFGNTPQPANNRLEKDPWYPPWSAGKDNTRTSCSKPSTGACA